MSEIPCELLFSEILSLLPADDLLRLRCICKSWRDTIDDPSFIQTHLHRQISNGVDHLILRGELCASLYSSSLQSNIASVDSKIVNATYLKHKPLANSGITNVLSDSCNGIMLVSCGYPKKHKFLWNPLTRESRRLPELGECVVSRKSVGLYHSVSGVGFDSTCNDFKVVRIAQVFDPRNRKLRSDSFVYSLRLDAWRRIKDFPYIISRSRGGVFVGGALHWIGKTPYLRSVDDLIVALDLGTEDYCVWSLPCALSGLMKRPAMHLGVLGGCLVLSCYYQIERLDVWLMEDYGVESSWYKLFSVGQCDDIGSVETLRPVAYSKSRGRVLLQQNKKELLWFDLQTLSTTEIRISGGPSIFSSLVCVGSLFRLHCDVGESTDMRRPAIQRMSNSK